MKWGILLVAGAVVALSGCNVTSRDNGTQTQTQIQIQERTEKEDKILKTAESFAIQTLDPHMDYQGWYTSIYGVTESLFALDDQSKIIPLLAESFTQQENVWTIKLKDHAAFSNGKSLNAEMVIKNLRRAGQINPRYGDFDQYTYEVLNEKTFTITTDQIVPTLINDLASPELAMVDLSADENMSQSLVATGPFVISEFNPRGTVKVKRNEKYWNGQAKLDGAVFYYMPEADTASMAMQNGELNCYTGVTSDAAELFSQDKDSYQLVTVPAARLQFYILNENRLGDSVRKAIDLLVDPNEIETYLNGTVTKTSGPFGSTAPYGQVKKPEPNPEQAKALLLKEGYSLNGEGYYEKDGEQLTVTIAYYASRSLDRVAELMQEQLRRYGIKGFLVCEEDPDGTYIATGDFDIGLFCMIADKTGDPYYFISSTIAEDSPYNCGGFQNPQVEEKIKRLKTETDQGKRAELSNQIIQTVIDEDAYGYVALLNKISVMRNGVTHISEMSPFDYYFLNVDSDITK
ncbi:ABC transporter substrate-binding protein [Clostridium sp. E02]|uniref:ABC transporter substrate-binding protein n=1 Tax=Clostridium sp. E02 TaxID=2487134 RepID=UPI0013DDE7B8|nr:ABC transporter substrate-binding protein [Clostridium sp. E02]